MATRAPFDSRIRNLKEDSSEALACGERGVFEREDRIVERARLCSLPESESLDRNKRGFIATLFHQFRLAKGTLVWTLSMALRRKASAFDPQTRELVEDILQRQIRHVEALDLLAGRLGAPELAPEVDAESERRIAQLFESLCRLPDDISGSDGEDLVGASLAWLSVELGVFSPTGYDAAAAFFERNRTLSAFADVVAALEASDARQLETIRRHVEKFRARGDISAERYRVLVEQSLFPFVELMRDFHGMFDFLGLGLVPDEFLPSALDRYFSLGIDDQPRQLG